MTAPEELTLYDMLWGDGFLLRLITDLIGLRGDEVDEFSAAVHHQLPGIISHPDIGESFFDHFVNSSSWDGEVVVVSRRRSHYISHSLSETL